MTTQKPDALRDYPVVIVLPILWGDQDALGHVNNTVPIRWFESARIAYLEKTDMGHLLQASGLGPILASITCHYRRQLHYPDTVHVGGRISRIGRSSMTMDHAVWSEQLGVVAADGTSTVVVFNYATNRPQRMPEDIRQACERTEGRTFGNGE